MSKQDVYDDVAVSERVAPYIGMTRRDFLSALVCGAGVGLFVGVLYALLSTLVFGAVLCRPGQAEQCAQAPQYAMIVAAIIGAIAGLVALARVRIYRPLFVVLFSTVSLWAAHQLVVTYPWYWASLILLALFAIAYALFAWLARIRSFVVAAIFGVLVLVLVRFIATA